MNRHATEVRVPCFYRRTWQDGFGARGWKLASTANDPEVITSTAALRPGKRPKGSENARILKRVLKHLRAAWYHTRLLAV